MLKYLFESKHTFEYNYIDSVIKNDKRILLHHNYILKNNTHVFKLSQPCEQTDNGNYLCDSVHLNPSSKCIQKLVHGYHSDCTYGKVYLNGIIKRIHDDIMLINSATVRISSSCNNDTQFLTGSYVIHFDKCNIYINGEEFPNLDITIPNKAFQPTLGLISTEIDVIDIPPTKYLNNLIIVHRLMLKK